MRLIHHIPPLVKCFQMSVVSFIYPQHRRSLGVNVLKGYLVERRRSPSRVPGEAVSKQSQLRHVSPMPSNCCLPKSQTTLGRFWLSQRPFFLSFSVYTCIIFSIFCLSDARWTGHGKKVEKPIE